MGRPDRSMAAWRVACLLYLLALLPLDPFTPSPLHQAHALCDHTYSVTTANGSTSPIHTTTANKYRGVIWTNPESKSVGICRVTAWLSRGGANNPYGYHYMKITGLVGSNLGTQLDSAYGPVCDNTTHQEQHWYFDKPVSVASGASVAIAIADNNSTAHPSSYHAWDQGEAVTGLQACAWDENGTNADCTSSNSLLMEISYAVAPYLTCNGVLFTTNSRGSQGYRRPAAWIEIPEWGGLFATDNNGTVAIPIPDNIPGGHHRLRARFWPPDGNESHISDWSQPFTYHIQRETPGGPVSSATNHSTSDRTATITGELR